MVAYEKGDSESVITGALPESRCAEYEYLDPLDKIWISTLGKLGMRLVVTVDAYAEYDGRGTIGIGTARNLDPDDCLAQIALHEMCHWLVEGEESRNKVNWGVDNSSLADLPREYAVLRLQATLCQPYGLRRFLANTTDHRAYYDALPENPLEMNEEMQSVITLAKNAVVRSMQPPWSGKLQQALAATERVVAATAPYAEFPSLYCLYQRT